jgi:uncharacterized secreted protein with C-terminal beta-propeller domain
MSKRARFLSAVLSAVVTAAVFGSMPLPSAAATEGSTENIAESAAESAEENAAASGEEAADDGSVKVSRIRFAANEQEIYDALKKVRYPYYDGMFTVEEDAAFEAAAEDAGPALAAGKEAMSTVGSTADWTDTNVRSEGVDEADVVKTDGRYIYILQEHTDLTIVRAEGEKLERMSALHVADPVGWDNPGAVEFFVSDGILRVISEEPTEKENYDSYGYMNHVTRVQTFDVRDPASPSKVGELTQDGRYLEARMRGGFLYLFTEWRPYVGESADDSRLKVSAGGEVIPAEATCIPNIVTDASYLVISSSDGVRPSEARDSKVLISGSQQLYVSTESIYTVNVDYTSGSERSEIVKFLYGEGKITGKAAGNVRGTVNNSFSIDEYNGYLRVLTTYSGSIRGSFLSAISDLFGLDYDDTDDWTWHNALFVLDEDMHTKGRIVDLAPGEDIRSARYFGDTVYFVTFRNTDPLFAVDLSNPSSPQVTDELKIPGFSEYLHPFGEGTLLGLGYDADELTGSVTGLKLSLFDISDPQGVKETDRTVLKGITWCPAFDDYKAVFADPAYKLTGFFLEDRYLLYRLSEEGGFERVLLYDFFEDSLQGTSTYDQMRALRIGETFYLAGSGYVIAFDIKDGFAKKTVLRLA